MGGRGGAGAARAVPPPLLASNGIAWPPPGGLGPASTTWPTATAGSRGDVRLSTLPSSCKMRTSVTLPSISFSRCSSSSACSDCNTLLGDSRLLLPSSRHLVSARRSLASAMALLLCSVARVMLGPCCQQAPQPCLRLDLGYGLREQPGCTSLGEGRQSRGRGHGARLPEDVVEQPLGGNRAAGRRL